MNYRNFITKTFNRVVPLGIGTLILSIVALYNGYPLVYSDTGTYIYSGFDIFVPFDRPITYGLFLKFFSFKYSTWCVILFQNLLTAFVVWECLKVFFDDPIKLKKIYLFTLLFLVLFTGVAWYSNQLMPDFFAPLTIISFFTLITRKKISLLPKVILILILLYASISHFSHLMIGVLLVILSVGFKLFFKEKFKAISLKRILFIGTLVLSSWVILPGINYLVEKKITISKGSHVFLMARLADTGILGEFLKENCSTPQFEDCTLCQYKDSLPHDAASFIWSGEIFKNTGGWENSKDEYTKIIIATLKRPKYLFANIYKSFFYGMIQLTDNEIGHGLSAYNEGSAPYGQISWRFHNELNNYLNSRQNKWNGANLNLDLLNTLHLLLIILSLFIFLLLTTSSIYAKLDLTTKIFLIFVIIAIVINSFITAGLNSPYGRLQTRVVWLFPLALIITIVKNYTIIAKTIYNKVHRSFKEEKSWKKKN